MIWRFCYFYQLKRRNGVRNPTTFFGEYEQKVSPGYLLTNHPGYALKMGNMLQFLFLFKQQIGNIAYDTAVINYLLILYMILVYKLLI